MPKVETCMLVKPGKRDPWAEMLAKLPDLAPMAGDFDAMEGRLSPESVKVLMEIERSNGQMMSKVSRAKRRPRKQLKTMTMPPQFHVVHLFLPFKRPLPIGTKWPDTSPPLHAKTEAEKFHEMGMAVGEALNMFVKRGGAKAMSDIRTRPATKEYRENFPFPEKKRKAYKPAKVKAEKKGQKP